MQNQFEEIGNGLITFKDVVALFSRWRKQLIILGIASIIVSSIVSFAQMIIHTDHNHEFL